MTLSSDGYGLAAVTAGEVQRPSTLPEVEKIGFRIQIVALQENTNKVLLNFSWTSYMESLSKQHLNLTILLTLMVGPDKSYPLQRRRDVVAVRRDIDGGDG